MFDSIILGGTIVDGTGSPAVQCDMGIKQGKIAAFGNLEHAEAKRKIRADGCIVAPGLIDIHTHTDYSIQVDPRAESQIWQGVTTEVVGLCGISMAPCSDEMRKQLIADLFQVDIESTWNTFSEYLSVLDTLQPATNIVTLVGHGALRTMVMPASSRARTATQEEIDSMNTLLEDALNAGAFGLSTGLEYYPGKAATLFELESLCKTLPRFDAIHAAHVRTRDRYARCGFLEVLEVARNSRSRLQISHINPKFGSPPKIIESTLQMVNWMREEGIFVGIDVMPSIWAISEGKSLLPAWAHDLPVDDFLALLRDPLKRQALKENPLPHWQLAAQEKWDKIRVISGKASVRHSGRTIEELSREYQCSGWDTLFLLLAEEGYDFATLFLISESFLMDDVVKVLLDDPWCSVGSDANAGAPDGPLAGKMFAPNGYVWCENFLREFIREKKYFSLEEGIRRITTLPAEQMGIKDRGRLAVGYCADVVIFNLEKLKDTTTFTSYEVHPEGIQTVIVNGEIALHEGVRSQKRAGQVLRHA